MGRVGDVMLGSLATAVAWDEGVKVRTPKYTPCALWETERAVECATDVGLIGYDVDCELGKVYQVCELNGWLLAGVAGRSSCCWGTDENRGSHCG